MHCRMQCWHANSLMASKASGKGSQHTGAEQGILPIPWVSELGSPQLPYLQQWWQERSQMHCHCLLPRHHHWRLAQLGRLSGPARATHVFGRLGAGWMLQHMSVVCDLRSAESNWFLLDPAVKTHAMSTVDHQSKGCGLNARTANGLVAKLVLAKGLSEKGLLLADIQAPPEVTIKPRAGTSNNPGS